jgi:hypothetical protein
LHFNNYIPDRYFFHYSIILSLENISMNKLFLKYALPGLLVSVIAAPASAATAYGTVTFLGTLSEKVVGTSSQARFRLRLTDSSCNGVTASSRWVHVESGTGAHNMENLRNAYGTLMAAQLSGKTIQLGGLASCDATTTQTISLQAADIGMY